MSSSRSTRGRGPAASQRGPEYSRSSGRSPGSLPAQGTDTSVEASAAWEAVAVQGGRIEGSTPEPSPIRHTHTSAQAFWDERSQVFRMSKRPGRTRFSRFTRGNGGLTANSESTDDQRIAPFARLATLAGVGSHPGPHWCLQRSRWRVIHPDPRKTQMTGLVSLWLPILLSAVLIYARLTAGVMGRLWPR